MMNFKDIRTFTYIGNNVIIDGVDRYIDTTLDSSIYAVQYHKSNDTMLEELQAGDVKRVEDKSKYQFALDKWEAAANDTQEDIDTSNLSLDDLKDIQKDILSSSCETTITNGFSSDALGTAHYYQSKQSDQTNLLAAAHSGIDFEIQASLDGKNYPFVLHTTLQIQKVHDAMVLHIQTCRKTLAVLKTEIDNASTKEEVESIIWQL
jgi:hypothetical protein